MPFGKERNRAGRRRLGSTGPPRDRHLVGDEPGRGGHGHASPRLWQRKKTWLEEQARKFEGARARISSGKLIRVDGRAMGSGEVVQAILSGELKAHVFSPASGAYVSLLNQAWLSQPGHTAPLSPAGEPVVLSPLVIATWRPMAEALGWPHKALGWKDLIKVSAHPKGWGAHGHAEWGPFKLGHTHPEFSNSGLLSVLAEAYAGAKKTRGLTTADVAAKATREFVTGVEKTIVHYGKSTGFFADKMVERGPSYLSAAVLYENPRPQLAGRGLADQESNRALRQRRRRAAVSGDNAARLRDMGRPRAGLAEGSRRSHLVEDHSQGSRIEPRLAGGGRQVGVGIREARPHRPHEVELRHAGVASDDARALRQDIRSHHRRSAQTDYQSFIAAVERGVSKFEASTGTFMTDMIRFGPSKYDIAVVHENLVISQIENAQGRWDNLRVYYPETTLWSDHPAALLRGEWVTDAQKQAARAFIRFLRSRSLQERALAYGFRPADPAVPIRTADAQNPYTRLAQYGIKVEIPPVATPPDGPVIRNMLTMWSRVVANR
ncbi:MAG TPA: substrate-binding domain-containing protein [Polyangiaceae bacterium]